MAYPARDRHVRRDGDHSWVYRRAGGDEPAHLGLPERVGRPLQQGLLAHDGAAQAHQHQRLARLTCPPLAGTFARIVVELGPDVAHIGRHRAGPEVVTGAGADQDPVRPGHQAGQAPHRRQPPLGADPVEGRHPAAEDRQRNRRRRAIP